MVSYGANTMLGTEGPNPNFSIKGWFSVDDVGDTSGVFVLMDDTFEGGWWGINVYTTGDPRFITWEGWRHPLPTNTNESWVDGGFNVLFCDGHVENQRDSLGYWQIVPLR